VETTPATEPDCQTLDGSVEQSDPTAHAELTVIRDYCQSKQQFVLSGYTLYASAEPCLMCSGAIRWSGITRVVYSVSQQRVQELSGARPTASYLPLVNAVYQRVEIVGPLLEKEGLRVFEGYQFDTKVVRHRELWQKKRDG
jgi:tRNA(adenine34) deaminase